MAKQPLKITVVTVTYNAGELIRHTIESVESQDYPCVEHLIIDGNSTDNTLEQVHRYMERNSNAAVRHDINCLTEPDEGIYDAMNKALAMMTGRYVVFMNAGDRFHDSHTLSHIAQTVEVAGRQPAVVYGDTDIIDRNGRFIRRRRLSPPADLSWHDFKEGMLVCHQAFFARTDIAKETLYDRRYRFSSDYDWTIRIMKEAERRELRIVFSDAVTADFLNEGATKKNHLRSLLERLRIMASHFGWTTALAFHFWFVVRAIYKK